MAKRIFLGYDQKALDDAYDQSVYAPNREQLLARFASASRITRERLGEPQRASYGPGKIEKLDIYKTQKPNAPINVFIPGGPWGAGLARDYAFPAEMLVHAGAHFVAAEFQNVLETKGR